ncbi:hypothetical protein SAMN02927900_04094 [Rhizobium mongolense subsp. loessense]|uniref:Uncharacterized protein n=1 Tax=Rhizobium mongolense subsp. loessense TaxID=158890 RepID=A0A1G4SQA9_9HYPH|nr:hypothetical protein SAMN02927900_04094 [Rhizobium mongolense subsp. loessense]
MPGNVVLFVGENKTQSQKAPEGASRCRVWTSGISLYLYRVPVGGSSLEARHRMSGGKQESADKVKRMRKNDRIAGLRSPRCRLCNLK